MSLAASLKSLSFWIALGAAFAVGAAGGLLTRLGPWYEALNKPSFQPPDWAFGPAWTIIFLLTAYAAHLAWESAGASGDRQQVLWLFGANALLNLGWSYLFFFIRRPDLALIEAALLWLSVLLIIVLAGQRVPLVRWLLVPYLGWVSFAIALNFAIVRLNESFSTPA